MVKLSTCSLGISYKHHQSIFTILALVRASYVGILLGWSLGPEALPL